MNLMCSACIRKMLGKIVPQFFLAMKMMMFLLTVCSLHVAAHTYAQKVTLNSPQIKLGKAFESIKQQTGYTFFYDYDAIEKIKPINIDIKNANLVDALNELFKNLPITYTIQDKVIVIREKSKDQPTTKPDDSFVDIQISGHVTDDSKDVLIGTSVALKGSKKVVVTNSNGDYTITLTAEEAANGSLLFSYVGYNVFDVKINGRKKIDVTLQKNIQQLTDVVITNGYSRPKRKEEVVGSVVTVSAEQLQTNRPIESFDKMLEGLVPGLQVLTNTELGTPVKINIRGQNALSNLSSSNDISPVVTSSQPLYVIDGVVITEQKRGPESTLLSNEQYLNPLAAINPEDIESISVLKDAAAAAIYGANSSNGVIIITTKKGKAGKTKLHAGYNYGWSQPINQVKWLSGPQYHDLVKELYINQNNTPLQAELLAGASDVDTKWFALTNQYGQYHKAEVELSGGSETTQFRFSTSYNTQQSLQKGNDYKQIFFRLRLDHQISKKLNFSASIAPTIINKNALNIYSNVPIIPNVPAYNADGTFYQLSNLNVPNPLAVLAQNYDYHSGGSFNGNIKFDYAPLKNLRFTSAVGTDILQNKESVWKSMLNPTGKTVGGKAQIYDRTSFTWITYHQVNWTPILKNKHKFDVLAGFEAQSGSVKLLTGEGTGYTYSRLTELSYAQNQFASSSKTVTNTYSYYGQLNYSYLNKYYAIVSSRYDASSVFGPDVQSSINAAVGIGWNINKEKFLNNAGWINLFRVRTSYGTTGNSRIGGYQAKGIYNFNSTGYNGSTSSYPSTAPNDALSWEKGFKLNAGIDFNFLNRFAFTVEYYQNILEDAISSVYTPTVNGFTTTLANIGNMRNRGVDVGLQAQIFKGGKFSWTSTLNFGYNKNIVLTVKDNGYKYSDNLTATVLQQGVSTSAIWGFKYAGADPATGTPLYYDKSGTVKSFISTDKVMANAYQIGDRLPKVQGGFLNTFSYKGISLSINIIYNIGGQTLVDYNVEADGNNLTNRNGSVNLLDRWQKPGDITTISKLSFSIPVVNSTKYMYDMTYLKLSNVSLSYSLPKKITDKLGGMKMNVFANGTNLFYWYKQKSPEGRNGIREYRFSAFPESQTFSGGVIMNL